MKCRTTSSYLQCVKEWNWSLGLLKGDLGLYIVLLGFDVVKCSIKYVNSNSYCRGRLRKNSCLTPRWFWLQTPNVHSWCKRPMELKIHILRFSNINMSSSSLPMFPQQLEIALGVKRALGILFHLWKNKAQTRCFGIFPICRQGEMPPPLALPCQPREFGPPMCYDPASATSVCMWVYVCVINGVGVMVHNTSVLWHLWYFQNKTVVEVILAIVEPPPSLRDGRHRWAHRLPALRRRAAGGLLQMMWKWKDQSVREPDAIVCDS